MNKDTQTVSYKKGVALMTLSAVMGLSLVACQPKQQEATQTVTQPQQTQTADKEVAAGNTQSASDQQKPIAEASSDSKGQAPIAKQQGSAEPSLTGEGSYTLVQAVDQIKGKYPNAVIKELGYKPERGVYAYKVRFFDQGTIYDWKISAEDGSLVHQYSRVIQGSPQGFDYTQAVKISDIIADALKQPKEEGWSFKEWELEFDDGYLRYKVELIHPQKDSIDVIYDAGTGSLVEIDD